MSVINIVCSFFAFLTFFLWLLEVSIVSNKDVTVSRDLKTRIFQMKMLTFIETRLEIKPMTTLRCPE